MPSSCLKKSLHCLLTDMQLARVAGERWLKTFARHSPVKEVIAAPAGISESISIFPDLIYFLFWVGRDWCEFSRFNGDKFCLREEIHRQLETAFIDVFPCSSL